MPYQLLNCRLRNASIFEDGNCRMPEGVKAEAAFRSFGVTPDSLRLMVSLCPQAGLSKEIGKLIG